MTWIDEIVKAVSPIKKKGFKKLADKKHVKTRTPYKAVIDYEKEFKHDYANMIGDVSKNVMTIMTKQLYKK